VGLTCPRGTRAPCGFDFRGARRDGGQSIMMATGHVICTHMDVWTLGIPARLTQLTLDLCNKPPLKTSFSSDERAGSRCKVFPKRKDSGVHGDACPGVAPTHQAFPGVPPGTPGCRDEGQEIYETQDNIEKDSCEHYDGE
jgi:hypothetical protein